MLYEKIRSLIASVFDVAEDSISRETSFVDDLGADSLDIVELVTTLEDEFDIVHFPEEEMKKITTVGSLVDCVEELAKG